MGSFEIKLGDLHILAGDFNVFIVLESQRKRFPQRQRMLAIHIDADAANFRQRLLFSTIVRRYGWHWQLLDRGRSFGRRARLLCERFPRRGKNAAQHNENSQQRSH